MAQEEVVNGSQPAVIDAQPPVRTQTSTYDMLMRQSKKLGRTATHTLSDAKQFLQQEVSVSAPSKILQNFSHKDKKSDTTGDVETLKRIVEQSHEVLAEVQTVFPFTLFPDKLYLDRSVITIITRSFFWSSNVISIRIEDILNVSTALGPIFGSLTIASRVMNSVDHYEITTLWRNDAIELKHMIQGYMIARHSKIDIDHLSAEELVGTLRQLGKDNGV